MQWGEEGRRECGDSANPQYFPFILTKKETSTAVPGTTAIIMTYTNLKIRWVSLALLWHHGALRSTHALEEKPGDLPLQKEAQAGVMLKLSGVRLSRDFV